MSSDKNEQWIKRSAAHYLGQRSSSVANLRRVLTRRARKRLPEEDPEKIETLVTVGVAFCVENGFVNDDSYAEMKAGQAARIGVSRRKLEAKLASKGVARETVSAAVSELDDEASAILFARRRRLGPWKTDQSKRDAAKDTAALVRAGFPIRIAIRTANLKVEDLESSPV